MARLVSHGDLESWLKSYYVYSCHSGVTFDVVLRTPKEQSSESIDVNEGEREPAMV